MRIVTGYDDVDIESAAFIRSSEWAGDWADQMGEIVGLGFNAYARYIFVSVTLVKLLLYPIDVHHLQNTHTHWLWFYLFGFFAFSLPLQTKLEGQQTPEWNSGLLILILLIIVLGYFNAGICNFFIFVFIFLFIFRVNTSILTSLLFFYYFSYMFYVYHLLSFYISFHLFKYTWHIFQFFCYFNYR